MNWINCNLQKPKCWETVLVTDGKTVNVAFFTEDPPRADICHCLATGNYLQGITHWAEVILPGDSESSIEVY